MKTLLLTLVFIINLFAQNVFVPKKSIYVNSQSAQNFYNMQNSLLETKALINLTEEMLHNPKFVKLSYLLETGKVKVNTAVLLKKLLGFLKGEKPYSNTEFDNNTKKAGILAIIQDELNNSFLNLPGSVKKNITDSIKSSGFFSLADKTEKLLHHVSKNNISDIVNNYTALYNQYINDILNLKIPLLQKYNSDIQQTLLKNYRIDAKAGLFKILEIFQKYLNQNKNVYN